MHNVIVKMSKHNREFADMREVIERKGEFVGALLGYYDYLELFRCRRLANFFFTSPDQSTENGITPSEQEQSYESQKLLLYELSDKDEDVNTPIDTVYNPAQRTGDAKSADSKIYPERKQQIYSDLICWGAANAQNAR